MTDAATTQTTLTNALTPTASHKIPAGSFKSDIHQVRKAVKHLTLMPHNSAWCRSRLAGKRREQHPMLNPLVIARFGHESARYVKHYDGDIHHANRGMGHRCMFWRQTVAKAQVIVAREIMNAFRHGAIGPGQCLLTPHWTGGGVSWAGIVHDRKREHKARFTSDECKLLAAAASLLESKARGGDVLSSPDVVKTLCVNRLAGKEHEVFAVLMLDSQHRLIEFVELGHGTIDAASVYPREVAKAVLNYNAAAVILSHNHPSGIPEPSQADKRITERLNLALGLLDVPVLDHIVVGLNHTVSFAERGWL